MKKIKVLSYMLIITFMISMQNIGHVAKPAFPKGDLFGGQFAATASTVRNALDTLNLNGTAKGTDAPNMILAMRPEGGFSGDTEKTIIDYVAPTAKTFQPEVGKINKIIVHFSENLSDATTAISDATNLVESMTIKGDVGDTSFAINTSPNSVDWITKGIARIKLPNTQLTEGNIIEINFKAAVTDVSGNEAVNLVSAPAVPDIYAPIGKILTPGPGSIDKITVVFSEAMGSGTKKVTKSNKLIKKAEIMKGMMVSSTIKLDSSKNLCWSEIDGKDAVDIAIFPTTIISGNYIALKYTHIVADEANNKISSDPVVVPVGGGGTPEAINEFVRKASGGKMPTLAIFESSRSNLASANDAYYSGAVSAFVDDGFDPVFIPIAADNHTNAALQSNVNLVNKAAAAYFAGGDQFLHARALLEDDGSDSYLMTAVRQIYGSGGVITGSSAGDNIMSGPMFGGGVSYDDLVTNEIKPLTMTNNTGTLAGSVFYPGFGFTTQYGLTDSHFDARGRLGRLIVALRDGSQKTGIGIDESTTIAIKGDVGKVIGENGVFIVDVSDATFGPNKTTDPDSYFLAKGIKVSYLTDGDEYNFSGKKVTTKNKKIKYPRGIPYQSNDVFNAYETTNIMKGLANSSGTKALGVTWETSPQFTLTFYKTPQSNIYKTTKYTIDKLKLDISVNATLSQNTVLFNKTSQTNIVTLWCQMVDYIP